LDKYGKFHDCIKHAVEKFKEVDKRETIRIVSHLDCDGITACAILIKALNNENRRYSISILQQLNKRVINELSRENYHTYIFADLGSGLVKTINEVLHDRKIFILDHHEFDKEAKTDLVHVNPHIFGIDGSKEISGSGVVYSFAKELNKKNESMAHIAIIGAIGDVQEEDGFKEMNNQILKKAVESGHIKVRKGLKVFGSQTKPLHKTLEYCNDPNIPGVSGSESGAIQFLQQLGINPKRGSQWRKLVQLTDGEMEKLIAAIVMKRCNETNPEDVITNNYILLKEKVESTLRDAKEFSTLLNACGRLNKASLGIGVCLNDKKMKEKALRTLDDYKKEIIKSKRWYEDNKDSNDVIADKGFVIVNAKDNILGTVVGTLASMLSRTNDFDKDTLVMSLGRLIDNYTKVSLRIVGKNPSNNDLSEIVREIIMGIPDCEAGGHCDAAGAIIPTSKEKEFIDRACATLKKRSMEESIV
jgi:RecJ-like exonuclease